MEWPPPARTASTVPDWKWVRVQSLRGGGAMKITTVGVDLAKSVFTVYGVDEHGKPALRKTVRRGKLLELFAQLPACVVGMEACSGAQHWARELRELGHTPRIMAAEFVEPYRRGGKNDTNDAAAICEAVSRPQMRFVPIKSVEQQAVLAVHRLRQGLVEERTALANRIRGLLTEYGLVIGVGLDRLRKALPSILEDADNTVPGIAREVFADATRQLIELDARIGDYDRRITAAVAPGVGVGAALGAVEPVASDESRAAHIA